MGFDTNVENRDGFLKGSDANSSCATLGEWPGATLAMIPSIEHNMMAAALLGYPYGGENPWVGIHNYAYVDYYFLNINKDPLFYTNWAKNNPNHLHANLDKCVDFKWKKQEDYFSTQNLGTWENRNCNERRPYVCSHPYDAQYTPANYRYPMDYAFPGKNILRRVCCYYRKHFIGLGIDCAKGWIPFRGSCYKYYANILNYESARKTCQDDIKAGMKGAKKGDLTTILDDWEYAFTRTFFRDDQVAQQDPRNVMNGGIWIGLKLNERTDKDGMKYNNWGWVDGWPLEVSKWATTRPANVDVTPDKCAYLQQDGTYMDTNCAQTFSFICKAEYWDWTPSWENFINAAGQQYDCPDGWSSTKFSILNS